jgi:hypothetical protein
MQWSQRTYFQHWREASDPAETFVDYMMRMSQPGEWGQHLEIYALSELYERAIEIYIVAAPYSHDGSWIRLSDRLQTLPNYTPLRFDGAVPIRLVFCGAVAGFENHYQSLLMPSAAATTEGGGLLTAEGAGPPDFSFERGKMAMANPLCEAARRQRPSV